MFANQGVVKYTFIPNSLLWWFDLSHNIINGVGGKAIEMNKCGTKNGDVHKMSEMDERRPCYGSD